MFACFSCVSCETLLLHFIAGFYSEGTTTSVPLRLQLLAWHLSHSSLSLPSSLSTRRHLAWCWGFVKPGAAVREDEPPGHWRQNHIEKRKEREKKTLILVKVVFPWKTVDGDLRERITLTICASVCVCVLVAECVPRTPTQWCKSWRWISACGGAGKR